MPATSPTTPTATPSLPLPTIALTTGSTIKIHAPASTVFATILNTSSYPKWNTWTPALTFAPPHSIRTPGSKGTLSTRMEAQNRDFEIPVQIVECSSPEGEGSSVLVWRSLMMPSWFARAERVQTVSPVEGEDGTVCELRQWESMSGWGVYLLKWVLGVEKQLIEANVKYAEELKAFVEGGSRNQ